MVTILPENPSFGTQIARGLGSGIGAGLAGLPERYMQKKQQTESNEAIKRLTGKDLSGLSPEMQKSFIEKLGKTPEVEKITEALINQGIDPQDAELYAYLTTGGQTAFVKDLLEQKKRKRGTDRLVNEDELQFGEDQPGSVPQEKPEDKVKKQFKNYLEEQDIGLTPSEKVARGKQRFDTGLKQYQEAGAKLRLSSLDKSRLGILEDLNKSDKLPKNLERLNVDKEGNLRLPFAASPESQRFVKTLNEFSSGAKDTFGSRVTNFDLQQYLRRFPTLMNTKEGRNQLLDQMKIVNQINSVYYKNLKNIYDKAGGARNIDADVAERFAEQLSDPKINELSEKFRQIGQFSSKPSATEFKGKRIRDKETGEIFVSDGENWVPAE